MVYSYKGDLVSTLHLQSKLNTFFLWSLVPKPPPTLNAMNALKRKQ
jgi:hypothetical protein